MVGSTMYINYFCEPLFQDKVLFSILDSHAILGKDTF